MEDQGSPRGDVSKEVKVEKCEIFFMKAM